MAKIHSSVLYKFNLTTYSHQAQLAHRQSAGLASERSLVLILLMTCFFFFQIEQEKNFKNCRICIENMFNLAFIQVSFLQFFVVFFQNYIFLLQVVFQCKNYSEITVETRTQLKSVIFTTDIFAVHLKTKFGETPTLHMLNSTDGLPMLFIMYCH